MKHNPLVALAAFVLVVFAASPATAFNAGMASTRGREMLAHVQKSESGPLWNAFDDRMRAAMKDSTRFAATLASIGSSLGTLDSVTSEQSVAPAPGTWAYIATCRFSKAPVAFDMTFAFDSTGQVTGMLVKPAAPPTEYVSPHLDYVTKTTLRLPFRGEWTVVWGGRTIAQNYHAVARDQRFATDLLIVKDGSTHKGEGKALTDYWCYGQSVLAPAAGTIVWMRDSLSDNPIGQTDASNAIGNGVIIDHGNGEYSVLAHMQPKSLRVKTGDRVKAGQPLGLVGNSGNTSEPHIHYHLQNGPKPFEADGLPIPFTNIVVDGAVVAKAEVVKGQRVGAGAAKP